MEKLTRSMVAPSTPNVKLKRGDTDVVLDQSAENITQSSKRGDERMITDEPKILPKLKHRPPV